MTAPKNMFEKFALNAGERDSPLWRKIDTYLEERIALFRAQNDEPLGRKETAVLRGRIKEAKALRALATEMPVMEAP